MLVRTEVPAIFVLCLLNAVALEIVSRSRPKLFLITLGAMGLFLISQTTSINTIKFKRLLVGKNLANYFHDPDVERLSSRIQYLDPYRVATVSPKMMTTRLELARSPRFLNPLYLLPSGLESLGGAPIMSEPHLLYWDAMTRQPLGKIIFSSELSSGHVLWVTRGKCNPIASPINLPAMVKQNLLRLANVKYLVAPIELEAADWELINGPTARTRTQLNCISSKERLKKFIKNEPIFSPMYIYRSRKPVAPRVYIATDVIIKSNKEAAAQYLQSGIRSVEHGWPAVLEQDTINQAGLMKEASYSSQSNCDDAKIKIVERSSQYLLLSTESENFCIAVINQSYSQEWHASSNQKQIKLFPVNVMFQGFVMPKGLHQIRINYGS